MHRSVKVERRQTYYTCTYFYSVCACMSYRLITHAHTIPIAQHKSQTVKMGSRSAAYHAASVGRSGSCPLSLTRVTVGQ